LSWFGVGLGGGGCLGGWGWGVGGVLVFGVVLWDMGVVSEFWGVSTAGG